MKNIVKYVGLGLAVGAVGYVAVKKVKERKNKATMLEVNEIIKEAEEIVNNNEVKEETKVEEVKEETKVEEVKEEVVDEEITLEDAVEFIKNLAKCEDEDDEEYDEYENVDEILAQMKKDVENKKIDKEIKNTNAACLDKNANDEALEWFDKVMNSTDNVRELFDNCKEIKDEENK